MSNSDENILKSIMGKLNIFKSVSTTEDEIRKAFTPDELNLIEKAKYIRREGTPGNYKYIYDEPKGGDSKSIIDNMPEDWNNKFKSIDPDIEKGGKGLTGEKKVAWVMREFKNGTLKDSHGKVVTDRKQAIAIAMSEAGLSKIDPDIEKALEEDIEKGRAPKPVGFEKETPYGRFRKTADGWKRIGTGTKSGSAKPDESVTKKEVADKPKVGPKSEPPKVSHAPMTPPPPPKPASSKSAKKPEPKVEPKPEPAVRKSDSFKKAIDEREALRKQIAELEKKFDAADRKVGEELDNKLEKLGFVKKTGYDSYGDKETTIRLELEGGKDFSTGKFVFEKLGSGKDEKSVGLKFRSGKYQKQIGGNFKDLEAAEYWIKQFRKNPSKAFDAISEATKDSYWSREAVKEIKGNYFTGAKSKSDVSLMSPSTVMEKFKIPNVSVQHIEGKRSSVYSRETSKLADNPSFFSEFKRYYAEYGKPTSIKTERFDSREGDGDYESAYRGEREWSASIGERVIVTFEDKANSRKRILRS